MRGTFITLFVLASITSSQTNAIQIRVSDDEEDKKVKEEGDEDKKTDDDSKEAAEGEQADKEQVQTEADTKEKFNTDESGGISLS